MQLMLLKFSLEPVWEWSVLYENSFQCLPCLSLPSLSFNQTIAVLRMSLWRRFLGLDQPIKETHLSADVITPNYSWRHQCLEIPCGKKKKKREAAMIEDSYGGAETDQAFCCKVLFRDLVYFLSRLRKKRRKIIKTVLSPSFLSEILFHFGVVPILGVNLALVSLVQSIYYGSG